MRIFERVIPTALVVLTFVSAALVAQGDKPGDALGAPTNLRILGPTSVTVDSDPASDPLPAGLMDPPPTGKHPYFEFLSKRPEVYRTFSLRNAAQVAHYAHSPRRPLAVTYDPMGDSDPRRQDGAKIVIPAERNSLSNQIRLPIDVTSGSVLITWEAWFGREFAESGFPAYKTFQFSSPIDALWCEVRTRFKTPGGFGFVDGRAYGGGMRSRASSFGHNISDEEPLAPQAAAFAIEPETWTRYWALFERTPTWDLYSLWVADKHRDPVQLFDQLQLKLRPGPDGVETLGKFWIEYNSSRDDVTPGRGPLLSYVRNVVMLRNVADVPSLLQRPIE